jgi:MFS family permease
MQNRWVVLAILFVTRVAMGFQFQSVAALSPMYQDAYGIDLASIGFLIALYLLPGLVISFPGGAIGAWFGDKRVVSLGLVLMVVGGAIMAGVNDWQAQLAGRLLSGTGGILLNVMMTKLVTDYFSGREIATAMSIYINSWPVGIALALVVVPLVGATAGLSTAMWFVTAVALVGWVLFTFGYQSPPKSTMGGQERRPLGRAVLIGLLIVASIWGLYNVALSMVFSFGPAMLVERGWTLEAASSTTSILMWLAVITVPAGGIIADRTGRPNVVIVVSCLGFAVALIWAAQAVNPYAAFIAMGIIGGLAAGPIVSLSAEVLSPGNRAVGMGLYYSFYYAFTVTGPILAGALSDYFETAQAAFHFGAGTLVLAVFTLFLYRQIGPAR